MYKNILITFSFIVFVLLFSFVYAQRNIGKVEQHIKKTDQNLLDIPVEQWMGKRFIFLEKPGRLQKYGYDLHLSKEHKGTD